MAINSVTWTTPARALERETDKCIIAWIDARPHESLRRCYLF
jgi:hypothetical protein